LLELRHELSAKFAKREERLNLGHVVEVCSRVEQANEELHEIISEMNRLWTAFLKDELTEAELYRILESVLSHEAEIVRAIDYLAPFPNARLQVQFYNYALRLFDFDYQSRDFAEPVAVDPSQLVGTCYVIVTDDKISDISNQLLIELRRRKSEVLGEGLEAILPRELVDWAQEGFRTFFEAGKGERHVLPFLELRQVLVLFRVQLEVRFSLAHGLQSVVHFFRSEDLREAPSFFYCADTDRVLLTCPRFQEFLAGHGRQSEDSALAFDLFGVELAHLLTAGERKAGDTIACSLVKQKNSQTSVPVILRVRELYHNRQSCLALFSV
jgi:hypothetical protein